MKSVARQVAPISTWGAISCVLVSWAAPKLGIQLASAELGLAVALATLALMVLEAFVIFAFLHVRLAYVAVLFRIGSIKRKEYAETRAAIVRQILHSLAQPRLRTGLDSPSPEVSHSEMPPAPSLSSSPPARSGVMAKDGNVIEDEDSRDARRGGG